MSEELKPDKFGAAWNALATIAGYLDVDVNDFDSDDGFEVSVGRLQDRIIEALNTRQPAQEPVAWMPFGKTEEFGEVALPHHAATTGAQVLDSILLRARAEGFDGTLRERMDQLGWDVRPVYATPPADDSHDDSENSAKRPLRLTWQQNQRDGQQHEEWTAPCGCAYHPEPEPHVHPCSLHRTTGDSHDKAVRLLAEEWMCEPDTTWMHAGRLLYDALGLDAETYLANQPKGEK